MKRSKWLFVLLALVWAVIAPHAVDAQEFELTVENIMRGPELVGTAPRGLEGGRFFRGGARFSWSPDSRYIYFRWEQPGVDTVDVVYRLRVGTERPERLAEADPDTIVAGPAVWSGDRRRAVLVRGGDLVLWERGRSRYLTRTPARESNPRWSEDGRTVYFQRDGNIFALGITTGELRQLTDIRRGAPPDEDRGPESDQRRFLIEQQKELFEVVRDRLARQEREKARRDSALPKPFYPGRDRSVSRMRVTPDGRFVLLDVREPAKNDRRIQMPLWITDDGYVDLQRGRSKVGDAQSKTRAAILEVATGEVTYVGDSVGEGDRDISGVAVSSNSKHALIRVETKDN
jgi:hypothetical protein